MRACLTGTRCGANAALPFLAGVACFAVLCRGFWVVKLEARGRPVKGIDIVDTGSKKRREERISQLPDDVICLIISQLTTKDAVRTSVLSRRWRHVYTLINEVRFFCYEMPDGCPCECSRKWVTLSPFRKFVEGVDTFLQHHSDSKIMSFQLDCCFRGCIAETFRKWMNLIGMFGVEKLTLRCCSILNLLESGPPVFSTDFLPESVKHLWLCGGSFQTPNINALNVLELDYIVLTSVALECLLSNCSSLQTLNLSCCVLPSKLRINGPNIQLKSMMICYCEQIQEIDLSASSLISFGLHNFDMPKLSFVDVPMLQNLAISFFGNEVIPDVVGKMAKDLPHLERLVFAANACFFEGRKMDGVINKLSNLRQLVLVLGDHNKLDLLELAMILDACPLLHNFQLSMRVPSTFNGIQAKRVVRRNTQLKEVEFYGFRETKNEYNFILCILKNVVFLERLLVSLRPLFYNILSRRWLASISNGRDNEKRHQMIRKRMQGQAISKKVEIIIA